VVTGKHDVGGVQRAREWRRHYKLYALLNVRGDVSCEVLRLFHAHGCEACVKCVVEAHQLEKLVIGTPRRACRLGSHVVLGLSVAHEVDHLAPRPLRCGTHDSWNRISSRPGRVRQRQSTTDESAHALLVSQHGGARSSAPPPSPCAKAIEISKKKDDLAAEDKNQTNIKFYFGIFGQ
jgi:hypothetical protein